MNNNTDKGLTGDIAPIKIEHEAPPLKKEFKAWHKPRKQWIRQNQWRKGIADLIGCIRLDGRPLRYLSLPGEDMLDIRDLSRFCETYQIRLRCLGFDEHMAKRESRSQKNISRNEVSENLEVDSVLLADNISVLKDLHSQGFRYVKSHGPFDVINLDLCGSISCVSYPDNHQVLRNLCEFQVNHSREKWLLFLTTRAEYSQVKVE
jgi:hypothetical protein